MKNPYKTLKSKIIHNNSYFKVKKDTLLKPNGKKGDYYIVTKLPFVSIAVVDKNHIHLVGQYRYAVKKYSWEIPQGGSEKNETLLQAAKRELLEETGITAQKWQNMGQFSLGPGHHSQTCHVFLAQEPTLGKNQPEDGEFLKLKKVSLTQFQSMILKGEIHDGPTLASWCKIKPYL